MRRPGPQVPESFRGAESVPVGAPRVGADRLDDLARRALERVNPEEYVAVVFDGEPLEARFLCNPCDQFLTRTRGGWHCTACSYVLKPEDAGALVAHRCALLEALAAPKVPARSLGVRPKLPWWRRLWKWI